MHYERDWAGLGRLQSAIHSPEFFLSPSGRTDPEAELRASLAAMLEPLVNDPNAHAKCRFPARRIWLLQHFPEYRESLQAIDCPDFLTWAPVSGINSVSVVFANGYLGDPASYYGHLFLKFNAASESQSSYLIDPTVNFGAIGTNQDGPLNYIFKGITGGYEGGFTPIEFYFHNASYTERELRDLWEYRLSLAENEVRYIVSHAWEVTGKHYTYYFFRTNCAYRVAELIEIVDGIHIIPKNRPWTIPQAMLQTMNLANHAGRPLIASQVFHPSRQTRLYERYRGLDQQQRKIVTELVNHQQQLDGPQMNSLASHERRAVIDTLLDYHQFAAEKKDSLGGAISADYAAALSARLSLPSDDSVQQLTMKKIGPEAGKGPSLLQVGLTHQQNSGFGQMLRIRPAYYDSLDVGASQVRHGSLSMGDLSVEYRDQRFRLLHLDLIAIDSINPGLTGLPSDRATGWRLRAGFEQERIGCRSCLVARLQGDVSTGRTLGNSDVFGTAYLGGALQGASDFDGIGFGRLGVSLVFRPNDRFGVRLGHEARRPVEARFASYTVSSAEARFELADNMDLRLRWDRDSINRMTLSVGRYW